MTFKHLNPMKKAWITVLILKSRLNSILITQEWEEGIEKEYVFSVLKLAFQHNFQNFIASRIKMYMILCHKMAT